MRSVSLSPWYFIPFLLNSSSSSLMILCCFFMKSISQWRCQNCFLNFCLVDRCWEFILPLIFFNMIFFLYSVINVTSTMLGFFSPCFLFLSQGRILLSFDLMNFTWYYSFSIWVIVYSCFQDYITVLLESEFCPTLNLIWSFQETFIESNFTFLSL